MKKFLDRFSIVNRDTDQAWESFGRDDPYFGAITKYRYHRDQLNEANREDFFDSGAKHIDSVFKAIRKHLDAGFAPRRVLDFGCGPGRLLVPLAALCDEVIGVDVSDSMLEEARGNCRQRDIRNVSLLKSDDGLSALGGGFDLIHSVLVFQHIAPRRGMALMDRMLDMLQSGGVGVLHFTIHHQSKVSETAQWAKRTIPFAWNLFNLLRRRAWRAPQMQMHIYDINVLFERLRLRGVADVHVRFIDHDGVTGAMIFFRRK
jgi:2-polyprenyl-3-methyl-5-hydroxy-6-metoxy-1,4-benzoquinol methylase